MNTESTDRKDTGKCQHCRMIGRAALIVLGLWLAMLIYDSLL
ncbi:MAG: hypothetical protein ACR2O4_05400 [Hyphomicrobiaceae bacterium]